MTEGVLDLHDDLAARARRRRPLKAVVLAGGKGTRLAPYTSMLPKPLMPIGDRSILEIVARPARRQRDSPTSLCVGYLAHLIEAVIGDRIRAGWKSGTSTKRRRSAPPRRFVSSPSFESTFLAMNGDILTDLNYNDLVEHHRASGNRRHHRHPQAHDQDRLRRPRVGRNGDAHRVAASAKSPR